MGSFMQDLKKTQWVLSTELQDRIEGRGSKTKKVINFAIALDRIDRIIEKLEA